MDEGKLSLESKDIAAEKRQELLRLFPEAQTEGGKIDFDQLKRALGDSVDTGRERYGMSWPGKADCFRLVQSPSTATLLPVRTESVRFDETENMIIEGDNLEVLKLLQKSYQNKVKMIYIDPPYNTGSDFVYPDDFTDSLKNYLQYTGQADAEGKKFSNNTESDGRFHSNWLNMMYPRLYLARNLLRDDGVIFISIDDREADNLWKLCDEVFGEDNFLGCAARVSKKANNQGDYWSPNFDYLLTYARNRTETAPFSGGVNLSSYDQIEEDGPRKGEKYQLLRLYMTSLDPLRGCVNQRYYIEAPDGTLLIPPGNIFPPTQADGESVAPVTSNDKVWRWTKAKYLQEKDNLVIKQTRTSNLVAGQGSETRWNVFTKTYLADVIQNASAKPNSLVEKHINQIGSQELGELGLTFDFAKPSTLINYLCEIVGVTQDDLVLDFFAGTGSTAQGVLSANSKDGGKRRFILVQLPEHLENSEFSNIAELTKERVRRIVTRQNQAEGQMLPLAEATNEGFRVFKLAPSNFKIWDAHTDEGVEGVERQMELAVNHIMPDRTAEDLFYEILMKSEYPLTAKVEKFDAAGLPAFSVEEDALIVCVERKVTGEAVVAIAKRSPSKVIFLDEAFSGNDQLKANAKMNFESAGVKRFETV